MNLKNFLLLTTLVCTAFFTSAFDTMQTQLTVGPGSDGVTVNALQAAPLNAVKKDCTVKVDVELEDGSTIKGEVMFEDITWWQCTKAQVASWWKRTF